MRRTTRSYIHDKMLDNLNFNNNLSNQNIKIELKFSWFSRLHDVKMLEL